MTLESMTPTTSIASVRLGVIGAGAMGHEYMLAARQMGVEVTALADIDEAKGMVAADFFGVPNFATDGQTILRRRDVDAVVLAIPTKDRISLAVEAFRHGKHVLLEKPVAFGPQAVATMIEASGDLVTASCTGRFRCLESARETTAWISSGKLGKARLVRAVNVRPLDRIESRSLPKWQYNRDLNGGGVVISVGIYDLDFTFGLLGWAPIPRRVVARTWNMPERLREELGGGPEEEVHFAAQIYCEDELLISIERGSYEIAAPESGWHLTGEQGTLRTDVYPNATYQLGFTGPGAAFQSGYATEGKQRSVKGVTNHNGVPRSETIWTGVENFADAHAGVLRNFLSAICGEETVATDLRRSLLLHRLVDAIYTSAALEAEVTFTHDPDSVR